MKKGIIITLSGLDGTGKSTQINLLEKKLSQYGETYVTSVFGYFLLQPILTFIRKSNGKKSIGPVKRNTHFLLKLWCFPALLDFWIIYLVKILPLKEKYRFVLCDRYFDDLAINICYYGYMPRFLFPLYIRLLPPQEIGFYLELDIKKARARAGEFSLEYYSQQSKLYQTLKHKLNPIYVSSIIKTSNLLLRYIKKKMHES